MDAARFGSLAVAIATSANLVATSEKQLYKFREISRKSIPRP